MDNKNTKTPVKNNAKMLDMSLFLRAGINPSTGLPLKQEELFAYKDAIRNELGVLDRQDAIKRYKWENLPNGLTGELIERILYYRGQGAFFYMKTDGNFYFLPYALVGSVDVYGRFKTITPLQFAGPSQDEKEKAWITGLERKPVYSLPYDIDAETFENSCVLLRDYTNGIGENITPRYTLQNGVLDLMSECFPLARTSLIANCGVKGMRVPDEDCQRQVELASKIMYNNAMSGKPFVPMVGATDFQDFNNTTALKGEEYLLYMQALDNLRLSFYGIKNGGLFQKKSHMLESEQDMNSVNCLPAYTDGLDIRQDFCDKVNAIWGLGISCERNDELFQEAEMLEDDEDQDQEGQDDETEEGDEENV